MSFKNDKEFDAKLMNFDGDRYDVVVLASMWAKELKKKDEYKHQPNAVVIKVALDDILSNRVSKEEVLTVSKKNLEAVNARILGVVLNGYDVKKTGKKDGYYYSYAYGYSNDDAAGKKSRSKA